MTIGAAFRASVRFAFVSLLIFVLLSWVDLNRDVVPSVEAAPPAHPLASGNIATCDEASLLSALAGGGTATFTVASPCVITVTATIVITAPTTLDGNGRNVSISGGNMRRIITTTAGVGTLTLQGITLTRGLVTSGANPNGGAVFVRGNLVLSNTSFIANSAAGDGGGAYITGTLTLTNSRFISNTVGNYGGGAYTGGAALLNGGLFQSNLSTIHAGGFYAKNTLTCLNTQFLSNTAGYSAGGVFSEGEVTLNGGLFQNNWATGADGGGLYTPAAFAVTNTQFLNNRSGNNGGGAYVSGQSTLNAGLFQNNRSNVSGGGLYAYRLTLTGTQFLSNTANSGGGGVAAVSSTTLNGGLFQNNVSTGSPGGGMYVHSTLGLTGTQFINNTANGGGGLYHQSGTGRIVNALFARNVTSNTLGAAISLASAGDMQILHTTIASPTLASGSAIYVASGTIGITNTIVASHTIGISNSVGTVNENYNLFFGNTTNKSGTISGGANDVSGAPAFFNPAGDDYHLKAGSTAINTGTNVSVWIDFEGDRRPSIGSFEIGYDEIASRFLFLPLIIR